MYMQMYRVHTVQHLRLQTWGVAVSLETLQCLKLLNTSLHQLIKSRHGCLCGAVGETGILSRWPCFEENGFRTMPRAKWEVGVGVP